MGEREDRPDGADADQMARGAAPMIRLQAIERSYGKGEAATWALRGVDLEVEAGAFLTVVGSSGSGKTTLLNIIGGLDSGYAGRAEVNGVDLKSLSDAALSRFRNRTVGFVFQHFHLLDHLDALGNVALPAFFGELPEAEARERAEQVLTRVGLGDKLHSPPGQLSGGQKQRVAIARALFGRPRLMLCDEPTGNLDTRTGAQVISLFESLNRDDGITVLAVTHEGFLFENATRTIRIEDGRIAAGEGEG